ncbi:MAG TPA: transglutaminaseTgpA domain-containing protein [Polyangia bacterium]|nr:transglutaminaseTgpA domain-containing protein [Polyangia bacterium]
MRFQATHKLATYLLVLAAFATLASAGAVSGAMAILFLSLVGLSWRADAGSPRAALLDRRLTVARLIVGAVLVANTWILARQLPEPDLVPVVDFVLVALAAKLFYRRNNRDDVHVVVLSFLLVLAAAALGGNFLFSLAFCAYVLAATWALVLFHLRREMEENYLVKHSAQAPSQKVGVARILASRRVVGAPFLLAMAGVALGVAAGAFATFALVPRMGQGLVFGAARASANRIGFSDDVTLGHYGTLSSDGAAVTMRATVPRLAALPTADARDRAASALYWRGTVYDSYEGGHWTRSRRPALRTVLGEDGRRAFVHGSGGLAPGETLERQVIDAVGLAAPVAFALDRPVFFEIEAPPAGAASALQLLPRWSSEVGLRMVPPGAPAVGDPADDGHVGSGDGRMPPAVRYVAYSRAVEAAGAAPARPLEGEALASYLQLPAALSPRVTELAGRVAGAALEPAARVQAVASWLRATHRYTLRLPRPAPGVDPVESFLFDAPEGHCEYFATATALLLRAAGVPTRYVNGYLGGEWNDVGHYVAVRDNRAHSWVEAYLPAAGWVRVDATPPLAAPARTGRLGQLLDALDYQWSRWIVGYDLSRQLDLGRRVARHLGLRGPDAPSGGRVPGWLIVVAVVLVVAAAASRVWPSRRAARTSGRQASVEGTPVQRLYARALERLARAGVPRRTAETPREYAARVAGAGLDSGALLAELTELYTAARFGGRPVDREALHRLSRGVAALGRPAAAPAA